MLSGIIPRLLRHYRDSFKFEDEITRAFKEFFSEFPFSEKIEGLFNEWLIFDFKLSNDLTLLEDYISRNPNKLPLYEPQIYRNLQNNVYGLLEVLKVDVGEGLEVIMVHTGEKYYVKEHQGSFQLEKGDLLFNRITKIDSHFEFIGADTFKLGIKISPSLRRSLKDPSFVFNPKFTASFLSKTADDNDLYEASDKEFDLEESLKRMDFLLAELGVSTMINAHLVYHWLLYVEFKDKCKPAVVTSIILNLVEREDLRMRPQNELVSIISDIYNNIPREDLGAKSPNEKRKEKGDDYVPNFKIDVKKLGAWEENLRKATFAMSKNTMDKALDGFYKTFKNLMKEEATPFFIYRIFANKAVCHQYLGEFYLAKKTNDLALKLNRNYDFAIDVNKKIKESLEHRLNSKDLAKELKKDLSKKNVHPALVDLSKIANDLNDKELIKAYNSILEKIEKADWMHDPSKKYFEFLEKLQINFTTEGLTTSERFDIKC